MPEQPGNTKAVPKEDAPVRVDFQFRRELAEKVEGNLANFCYQCGACVGDCPATTYSSDFNPREIMLKVLYGLEDELMKKNSIVWVCTNCYNCHERCPQEVKPVEVIISMKNMLADRGIYPEPVKKVIDQFEKSGRTTPLSSAVDRQRQKFGLAPMTEVPMDEVNVLIDPDAEPLVKEGATAQAPAIPAAKGDEKDTKRVAFFPGCLIPVRHPAMEFAIRDTIGKLGVEVVDLEGASCCPDPIYFKSKDKVSWLAVAARNLTLAEEQGVDIFTNCSGCTATLSETYHLLHDDEELKGRVNERLKKVGREYKGTSRIRHIATLARDVIGYDAIRESVVRPLEGLKIAIHYGCHLLKPSKVMDVDDPNNPDIMEKLVEALGATPVRHKNWYLCCGKASQDEDVPANMMHDLLGTVHEEEADILGLICPTCFGQFDIGQAKVAQQFEEDFNTPAVYYFQLLAFAQGVPYDKLGFERQRFKPLVLKKFEEVESK